MNAKLKHYCDLTNTTIRKLMFLFGGTFETLHINLH